MKYVIGVPLTLIAIVGVVLSMVGQLMMAPLAKLTGRHFHCSWS